MSGSPPGLSIGTVAERTGLSVPVLRSWEHRHGFPASTRLPSGHRRYDDRDVAQVLAVLEHRRTGLSLEAAVALVRAQTDQPARSVFAELRRAYPEITPAVLNRHTMLAISRAIEDEFCARAERPFLLGAFQEERYYRSSERRWHGFARTAVVAVVMADFASPRPTARPIEIGLDAIPELHREWVVVCDAPGSAACLAAWERPGTTVPPGPRQFEAIWTVDPAIVRYATLSGAELVARQAPALADLADRLAPVGATTDATLRRATELTNRIIAYLGG